MRNGELFLCVEMAKPKIFTLLHCTRMISFTMRSVTITNLYVHGRNHLVNRGAREPFHGRRAYMFVGHSVAQILWWESVAGGLFVVIRRRLNTAQRAMTATKNDGDVFTVIFASLIEPKRH